jgi:hypothetical protein
VCESGLIVEVRSLNCEFQAKLPKDAQPLADAPRVVRVGNNGIVNNFRVNERLAQDV